MTEYKLYDKVITDRYKNEIFTVIGIRPDELELQGDWSGGTINVCQISWYPIEKCTLADRNSINVATDIMEGLYLICAGVSPSFSGLEVYQEAIPSMEKSLEFVIQYGHDNKIDCHGGKFKK